MLELYTAIWRISATRQLVLVALSIGIGALAAAPLNFQKEIVNLLTEGSIDSDRLFILGAGMIGVILLSLLLKWLNGYRAGLLGEDVIRQIRQRLIAGAQRLGDDGRVHKGTLTTAVSAEAEEVGKFAGIAFSEPVLQVGTLISVIGFIVATQPKLGLIALAMIVPQIVIVLLSQVRVNSLVAARVHLLRKATNKITADGVREAAAEITGNFDAIYAARRRMFIWKLSTKFVLSAINGIGTVAVLMLGGWFVLYGETDIGTVVAATIGLSRIQGPTSFLIAFYRQVSANRVKYELLRDVFGKVGSVPEALKDPS